MKSLILPKNVFHISRIMLIGGSMLLGISSAQVINFIDIVDSSVAPGDTLTVRVNVRPNGAQVIDLSLVPPGSTQPLPSTSIRFLLLPGTQTNVYEFPIPTSFCRPNDGVSGWSIHASIPSGPSDISPPSDDFSILFDPAELFFDVVTNGQRLVLSNSPFGTPQNVFALGEQIYLQAILSNSGCLAQTGHNSIVVEVDGQQIFGPTPLGTLPGGSSISLADFYPGISVNQPGNYTMTLRIGGPQTGTYSSISQNFTVVDQRANLDCSPSLVFSNSIFVGPGQQPSRHFYDTENLFLAMGLQNTGNTAASPSEILVLLDNLTEGTQQSGLFEVSPSLSSGSTASIALALGKLSPGNYRLQLLADPNRIIDEQDEFDNLSIIEFQVISVLDDSDGDDAPLLLEMALGTSIDINDESHSRPLTKPEFNQGQATIVFGRGADPVPNTIIILERAETLSPNSFTEIYRFNTSTQTETLGNNIISNVSSDSFSITDENPPEPTAFYRINIIIEEP